VSSNFILIAAVGAAAWIRIDFGAKVATCVDTFMDVIRWNNSERIFVQMASGQGAWGGTG
jgi:hypothetical protein